MGSYEPLKEREEAGKVFCQQPKEVCRRRSQFLGGDCNCPGVHGPGKRRCKQSGGSWDNFFTQLPGGPARDPVLAKKEELLRNGIIRVSLGCREHAMVGSQMPGG